MSEVALDAPAFRTHPNPFVFVVGCPRSGTTLLRRMVGAHSEIAMMPESHWIPRLINRGKAISDDGFLTPAIVPELERQPRFMKLGIDAGELLHRMNGVKPVPYPHFVSSIFDLYGAREGKALVGDKTPAYVRYISMLHSLWPDTPFVHIIRDGRDVALSATSWSKNWRLAQRFSRWNAKPVQTAALWWEWNVRLGREAGAHMGDLYYEVRYEELVANPERECRRLCEFLSIGFDNSMLRYHEIRATNDPDRSWLPPTIGLRDWRSQMAAVDVQIFESVAGALLEELGYELRCLDEPRMISDSSKARGIFSAETGREGVPAAWIDR